MDAKTNHLPIQNKLSLLKWNEYTIKIHAKDHYIFYVDDWWEPLHFQRR